MAARRLAGTRVDKSFTHPEIRHDRARMIGKRMMHRPSGRIFMCHGTKWNKDHQLMIRMDRPAQQQAAMGPTPRLANLGDLRRARSEAEWFLAEECTFVEGYNE